MDCSGAKQAGGDSHGELFHQVFGFVVSFGILCTVTMDMACLG